MIKLNKITKSLTLLFFIVVGVLAFGVYFNNFFIILTTRVGGIFLLCLIYLMSTFRNDKIYLLSMFFSLLSILSIFIESEKGLLIATIFFVIYRILTIHIVIKKTKKVKLFPIILGFLPFLSILIYLIFLTQSSLGLNYIPAIVNALLISFLAGIALSNYVLEDDIKNSWLLISTILFALLIFIFMIKTYYVEMQLFKPIQTICFFGGHYFFMRYIILSEHQIIMDLPCEITVESESK
jgi:hypothetical protein